MKKKAPNHFYRTLGHIVISALMGNARIGLTIVVYAALAVLLLTYVSAQVMTGLLTQEIAGLSQERDSGSEKLNKLTAQYVSLSSRARVTQHCENVGMRAASEDSYERFAVDSSFEGYSRPAEFTKFAHPITDRYQFSTLHRANGKSDG